MADSTRNAEDIGSMQSAQLSGVATYNSSYGGMTVTAAARVIHLRHNHKTKAGALYNDGRVNNIGKAEIAEERVYYYIAR